MFYLSVVLFVSVQILYPPPFSLNDCCPVVFPQAQAVSLTVAQAFRVAFEFWEVAKEGTECHISPQNNVVVM